ncbi:transposase [Corynebacterium uterequi]|uniref:Transposase n=1 Tax=Corynebacterium uterequi TaxID=1072256 RepID=A0A0G3HGQ8_9CORY|nr:transposase [Corynebacterium uterequi]AKK10212.1 transposase [Corynebacterium uterequi]AKK10410.1 transposase [Corynebacterium uterequi]AKK11519.1 transposase [Corynebacterium uterequi]AKK11742.1 transposase [Corynebacterium uterequi]AKK11745.1 transposase [Corynebacterium uterequi]
MATRKTYTPEYRREAARLVLDTGRPISVVAKELNINASLLSRWVKKERQPSDPATHQAEVLDADERAELLRLRKQVAELKLDNEFLGKAAAFFASKQQK